MPTSIELYAIVDAQIKELHREIEKLGVGREEAAECAHVADLVTTDDIQAFVEVYARYEQQLSAQHCYIQLDQLLRTKHTAELTQPETTYVITDEMIVSPAGFPLDSGVFIKNKYWIETDVLPYSYRGNAFTVESLK
jgi:hypothetical protein